MAMRLHFDLRFPQYLWPVRLKLRQIFLLIYLYQSWQRGWLRQNHCSVKIIFALDYETFLFSKQQLLQYCAKKTMDENEKLFIFRSQQLVQSVARNFAYEGDEDIRNRAMEEG